MGQRRLLSTPVRLDRRLAPDRRLGERRTRDDRRSIVPRRSSDRRRVTPAPYSPEQVERLRRVVIVGRSTLACPSCETTVTVDPPLSVRGTNVWEVHCSACFRSAMITDSRPPTVMIVNNDPSVGSTLELVVRRAGHDVRHFTDPHAALESYHDRPAEVVLLEMVMPDMSGVEFMRKLQREFPDARVIAMAGQRRHGAPDPLASAQRLGADHILRKPFTPPELLRTLDLVLGARRHLSR